MFNLAAMKDAATIGARWATLEARLVRALGIANPP
jgi:hypothetical protein